MGKVILVADDDENDLTAICHTLRSAGVKNSLITVGDGDEVIAYFKGDNKYADRNAFPIPSVLLIDLKMRRIGGFEVLRWIREQGNFTETLVVVLSGHGELENVRLAYQSGARSFLTKPCHMDDVKNLVQVYSSHWDSDIPQIFPRIEGNELGSQPRV